MKLVSTNGVHMVSVDGERYFFGSLSDAWAFIWENRG